MGKFSSERDPAKKKNLDRKNKEIKIHKVSIESRSSIKMDLRKVLRGEMSEEEFEEAHGNDDE